MTTAIGIALAAIIPAAAACQSGALPGGRCGLEVSALVGPPAAPESQRQELHEPYAIELGNRVPGQPPLAIVEVTGHGWRPGDVAFDVRNPAGEDGGSQTADALIFEHNEAQFWLDEPGTWQFRVHNAQAGCSRDFTIQVLEPATLLDLANRLRTVA